MEFANKIKCVYPNCSMGCSSKQTHRARFACMNSRSDSKANIPKKVLSNKLNYPALINLINEIDKPNNSLEK